MIELLFLRSRLDPLNVGPVIILLLQDAVLVCNLFIFFLGQCQA